MDFSKVSYGQVKEYSNQLKTKSENMRDLLQLITNEFEKLGQDDVWSGDAAQKVREEFDTLSAKFPEFNTAIQNCATYLDSVVANYENVDSVVQNIEI